MAFILCVSVNRQRVAKVDSMIVNTAASMRVLNVLRHWVAKHPFDFIENKRLKEETLNLLHTMLNDQRITNTEKKVTEGIIKQLNLPREIFMNTTTDLEVLLSPPDVRTVEEYDRHFCEKGTIIFLKL